MQIIDIYKRIGRIVLQNERSFYRAHPNKYLYIVVSLAIGLVETVALAIGSLKNAIGWHYIHASLRTLSINILMVVWVLLLIRLRSSHTVALCGSFAMVPSAIE